jgi:hypothetical protein
MKKVGNEMGDDAGEDWGDMVDEAVEQEEGGGQADAAEAPGASDDL